MCLKLFFSSFFRTKNNYNHYCERIVLKQKNNYAKLHFCTLVCFENLKSLSLGNLSYKTNVKRKDMSLLKYFKPVEKSSNELVESNSVANILTEREAEEISNQLINQTGKNVRNKEYGPQNNVLRLGNMLLR